MTLRNVSAAGPSACACLAFVFHVAFVDAQSRQSNPLPITLEQAPGSIIKRDVKLALVNVSVSDPFEHSVGGLEQENFRVLEDGIEQEVVRFNSMKAALYAQGGRAQKESSIGVAASLQTIGCSARKRESLETNATIPKWRNFRREMAQMS